ncbi:MAG: hypothetical protein MRY59_13910 [Aquisalinus sp.]|nr:hypothetical protein [Aquisalinus sp.]
MFDLDVHLPFYTTEHSRLLTIYDHILSEEEARVSPLSPRDFTVEQLSVIEKNFRNFFVTNFDLLYQVDSGALDDNLELLRKLNASSKLIQKIKVEKYPISSNEIPFTDFVQREYLYTYYDDCKEVILLLNFEITVYVVSKRPINSIDLSVPSGLYLV